MGLQIGEIVPRKAIEFSELSGKTIAIDAYNAIYQFLSSIRQPDGTPLMDSKKRVTSHLSGLFYRNINLLSEGMNLIYVFDGEPPELKYGTNIKRAEAKDEAREKYERARDEEDISGMGKYARQNIHLTAEIMGDSKKLLEAMGIAVIQAPSEGEAQAASISKSGNAYAVGSQDYDSLLFGAPRLIQNLTLARTRRTVSGMIYISPEVIELDSVLNSLGINLDQLICLGILAGTDYNPGGIKGIGQKKALDIVKKYREPYLIFKSVAEKLEQQENKFDWQEIFPLFRKPDVSRFEIKFPKMNEDKIRNILVSEHDFSLERINNQLEKLSEVKRKGMQRKLF